MFSQKSFGSQDLPRPRPRAIFEPRNTKSVGRTQRGLGSQISMMMRQRDSTANSADAAAKFPHALTGGLFRRVRVGISKSATRCVTADRVRSGNRRPVYPLVLFET